MRLFRPKVYADLPALVRACQRREARAQSAFYEHYQKRLLGVCLRYARTTLEAEDIFQDAFIKVFNHIDEIEKPESVDSWVKSVVIRTAINYYHRTTKLEQAQTIYESEADERISDDHVALMDRFSTEMICAIINTLPTGYRLIVNLFLIDGYTHAEIAALLGISENTSKSQLSRGRSLLIQKLTQRGIRHPENV